MKFLALAASAIPLTLLACSSSDDGANPDILGGGGESFGGAGQSFGGQGLGGQVVGGGGATGLGGAPVGPSSGGALSDPGGAGGAAVGAGGAVPGAGGSGTLPPNGTEYEFTTSNFSVAPGSEVYKCQDFPNPFGKDIGIVEMTTDLTPGSHHMFAFVISPGEATLTGSLQDCPAGGVEFHDYLTTNGSPHTVNTYPAGIGRVFSAGAALRLNVHLINTDQDAKNAFVKFKVKYVDPSTLPNKAASIFLNNVAVRVPQGTSTASKTYTLTQEINLMGAASHMHKQGTHFVAKTGSGVTLYDGTDWEEPKPQTFSPALNIKANDTITWSCTYQNNTGKTLTFGESALTNEMCIFPGEFYNQSGQQISYQALF